MRSRLGAPGLWLFQSIAAVDVFFLTIVGISYFSSAISEEKEEDTLGLMLLAGISPLGILAGKAGGRLCQTSLAFAVQYPFFQLAVTLGGVTSQQVWAMSLAVFAYMVFLSGLGLLCSTIAPRSRTAGILMVLGIVIYFGLPDISVDLAKIHSSGISSWMDRLNLPKSCWSVVELVGETSIKSSMMKILDPRFSQSAWSLQVGSNLAVGATCAGLSRMLFRMATENPSSEANQRGHMVIRHWRLRFTAGRPWSNPFIWKDFHFVADGIGRLFLRTIFYTALAMIAFVSEVLGGTPPGIWIERFLTWTMWLLPVDAALLASRSMQEEVRCHSLGVLTLLPYSSKHIINSKLVGALLGWVPGPMIGMSVLLGTKSGREVAWYTVTHIEGCFVPSMFLFFALVPHFAALFALYLRWGAVPLAIGAAFLMFFISGFCVWTVHTILGEWNVINRVEVGIPVASGVLCLLFWVALMTCRDLIWLRVWNLRSE